MSVPSRNGIPGAILPVALCLSKCLDVFVNKTFPDFSFEASVWEKGFKFVAGIDEVGRGAFAGPVVAGAVVFPRHPERTSSAYPEAAAEGYNYILRFTQNDKII